MENKHAVFTMVAVLCLAGSAWGQGPEAESVKGEVQVDSSGAVRTEVTLTDMKSHRTFATVHVGSDGNFEFRRVPYGDYSLTVLDGNDKPVHDELVSVHGQTQPILVQAPQPKTPQPPAGAVSVFELLHPPARKAFQAFLAARKLSDRGAHDKAAAQLEQAVGLSPEFADAWVNLAAQHIYLRRFEEALRELARASEISKPTAVILADMAFAQYALHRYDEATHSARQALQLDPSSTPAHFLLGSFLALDRRTLTEGIQHLEAAARTMPAAQANLERAMSVTAQLVTHP